MFRPMRVFALALILTCGSGAAMAAQLLTYKIEFSTYFGGSGSDMLRDITVDAQGSIYVAGIAGSADFPRTPGTLPGNSAAGSMLAKFSSTGGLVWSKVVKGPFLYSVKVERAGCLYVAGRVAPGFPTTPGAFQPITSRTCGFVGKLKPDASDWLWCSYVGTGNLMRDMTIDDEGNVYGVLDYGAESKEVLPTGWFQNAFCKTPHTGTMNHFGHCDAGIIKISNTGKVIWATWIGGTNGNDNVASVAVGKDHCPVIMLNTASPDMPTTAGAFCKTSPDRARQLAGLPIPWVGKLSADGSRLILGTYLGVHGGMPLARTHNVALDAAGNIFATFQAQDDLPVTAGAFQAKFGGGKGDVGIEKISPTGALLAATYLGGSGQDACNGPDQIVVDGDGNVMIACCTSSIDYPVTAGAFQTRNAGAGGKYPFDGAVSILSNDLRRLDYSTYIGGSGDEMARACCFGPDGTIYVGGVTTSRDFPTKNAFQAAYGGDSGFGSVPNGGQSPVGWGNGDCWVAKFSLLPGPKRRAAEVPIVVSPQAAPIERLAAEELAEYLRQIYPQDRFTLRDKLPASGLAILLGSMPDDSRLKELLVEKPEAAESYVITTARNGQLGIIAGADPRGVAYGVYAILEKLGCGFYLSYDAIPPARRVPFTFDGWQLADRPLVRDRLVFNWHNFLSGCSTWNLPEWNAWTLQSQKQGYNAVMVHSYGNNPMVSFAFNGKTKPVGYLSTTIKGRDWSTMHVNDVRRLWGGEVFGQPVFGAEAAMAPDEQRAAAAQKLMQEVFAYAEQRDMGVFFADDVDTISANPQDLILSLPPEARFSTGSKAGPIWMANPDTSDGYRYYKAQVASLLTTYPQITCLVVWFRNGGTPWMDLKIKDMPADWQEQYGVVIAKTPSVAKFGYGHNLFAIGKIVRAFDRALKELGHDRVQLAAGTWHFNFLPAADLFLPPHVKLIGLDYGILHDKSQLGSSENREMLAQVGGRRKVIPVIWAQHDDGNYIGRPYTPFPDFHAKLVEAKAAGFGIIHWTTRPLDLFFASHIKQVWKNTENQPLPATCADLAARSFGGPAREKMGEYLERWVSDAPKFARETSDRFIDRQLIGIPEVVAGCLQRLKMIEAVDAARLDPQQRQRMNYFRGLEEFIAAFHRTQAGYQAAEASLKKGDIKGARAALAECHPEQIIEQFAAFSAAGITRGERGLVVSLNTRWLSHYVRLRQVLGMDPVRYCFGPTSHDPLAQAAGKFTFHFDTQHHLWQTLGSEEIGATTFVLPADAKVSTAGEPTGIDEDLCRSGIEGDKPITLTVRPIMYKASLRPGKYRLQLWMIDPTSSAAGQRVFSVKVCDNSSGDVCALDRIDIFKQTGEANRPLTRTYFVNVGPHGEVNITLTPVLGKAILCAAVLEPVAGKVH